MTKRDEQGRLLVTGDLDGICRRLTALTLQPGLPSGVWSELCLLDSELRKHRSLVEIERLAFALHRLRAHPDFEYATTQTARKSGSDPRIGLDGEGWEPNDVVESHEYADGVVLQEHWRNWERFEFHEDNHWRRRKVKR